MTRTVEIAGGGVAGLALGIALRQDGVPVRLYEAGTYPRHRLCGEFISGAGPDEFSRLGLEGLPEMGETLTDAMWFRGGRQLLHRDLPEPALGISRWCLDKILAERFTSAGGGLSCTTRIPAPQSGEGWINATGRAKSEDSRWLGQKAHYLNLPMKAGLEMHLGRGGYAGISRIGSGITNVCALLPASLGKQSGDATLPGRLRACGLPLLAERLESAEEIPASRCGVSRFVTGWQRGPDHGIRLGDHGAIIPPFTGHGMSMALISALEAAPFLTKWASDRLSWNETCRQIQAALRRRFSARLRWAAWLHPFILRPGGQAFMTFLARSGLLPWHWLYRRVR